MLILTGKVPVPERAEVVDSFKKRDWSPTVIFVLPDCRKVVFEPSPGQSTLVVGPALEPFNLRFRLATECTELAKCIFINLLRRLKKEILNFKHKNCNSDLIGSIHTKQISLDDLMSLFQTSWFVLYTCTSNFWLLIWLNYSTYWIVLAMIVLLIRYFILLTVLYHNVIGFTWILYFINTDNFRGTIFGWIFNSHCTVEWH